MSSSRALLLLSAGALAAGLTACAQPKAAAPIAGLPRLPTDRYEAKVAVVPQQLLLRANAQGLSQAQRTAVYDMMSRWRSAQGGPIVIEAPSAGGEAATQTANRVVALLADYGVSAPDVSVRRYEADAAAPVRISFPTYTAEAIQCGLDWDDLARPTNETYTNYGCAVTANIAAMIANPADLAYPPPATAPDASRRQTVLEKYRAGTDPSTTSSVSASTKAN